MKKHRDLSYPAVKLPSGWRTTRAWKREGPVALIEFKSPKGDLLRSRLDLNKGMFIDSLPVKITPRSVQKIRNLVSVAAITP